MRGTQKNIGTAYILLVLRSLIYGSTVLFTGRLLQTTGVLDVLALRFLFAAAAFCVPVLTGLLRVDYRGKDLRLLALAAIFEPLGYFVFETLGIAGTSTVLANILGAVSPVIVILLETLLLRERTTSLQKLLLCVGIGGVLLISLASGSAGGSNTVTGVLCLLAAHTCGGLFLISSRRSAVQFTALEITFFTTLVGAVTFNGANLARRAAAGTLGDYFAPLRDPQNLMGLLFLAVMASLVATCINNYGVARLQASSVTALNGLSPLTGVLLGVLLDGEKLYWYHAVGGVLILAGATGVNLLAQKRAKEKKADA